MAVNWECTRNQVMDHLKKNIDSLIDMPDYYREFFIWLCDKMRRLYEENPQFLLDDLDRARQIRMNLDEIDCAEELHRSSLNGSEVTEEDWTECRWKNFELYLAWIRTFTDYRIREISCRAACILDEDCIDSPWHLSQVSEQVQQYIGTLFWQDAHNQLMKVLGVKPESKDDPQNLANTHPDSQRILTALKDNKLPIGA